MWGKTNCVICNHKRISFVAWIGVICVSGEAGVMWREAAAQPFILHPVKGLFSKEPNVSPRNN